MSKKKSERPKRRNRHVSKTRYERLLQRCRELPPTDIFVVKDYITNLLITVLDLRLETTTVERALKFYQVNCAEGIGSFSDLRLLLESGLADSDVARQLWGYGYGNRIATLRRLVRFFDSIDVTTQPALEAWAQRANFERDFKGRVHGLAYAAFKWLIMRVGVETIKPDLHVLAFVEKSIGFRLSDSEAVMILERAARDLGIRALQLDAQIWTYQRGLPSSRTSKRKVS